MTLHLTLRKKWFDMIASGDKKEEYREFKDYWVTRLCDLKKCLSTNSYSHFKDFDTVIFRNGYSKNAPTLVVGVSKIDIGETVPEWSDNWSGKAFRIHLGKIITTTT